MTTSAHWTRWPLHNGDRVFVRGQPTIGMVAQVGRVEVAVWFPHDYQRPTKVFAWGDNIVPVDAIMRAVIPELYS